jgi:hypothetical protein
MDSQEASAPPAAAPVPAGWGSAVGRAVVILMASVLVLVIVPNQLLTYLSLRVVPKERDLLVTLWWAAGFVGCCWLFLRLQRGRAR